MAGVETTARHLMQVLYDHRVRIAFGVHGANIEDMYAAAQEVGITAVVAKHEFAAGAMADAHTRMTTRPGVVMTTSGGGAMNVIPALAEAYDSRVPVLALIGSAPTTLADHGAFQDMLDPPDTIDLVGVLAGVTGSCSVLAQPESAAGAIATACATLHRGLPAALVIPKDIQSAPVAAMPEPLHHVSARGRDITVETRLDALADRLVAAAVAPGRVCLWVGEEASRLRLGPEIDELADLLGASTVASPGGRDVLHPGPGCAGITGVMGHPSAHDAMTSARLCVALGCRMSVTDRAGLDDALRALDLTHIGCHRARFDECDEIIDDDLVESVRLLVKLVAARVEGPTDRPSTTLRHLVSPPTTAGRPPMRTVIDTIGAHLPPDCAVFADAGNVGAAAVHHLPFSPHQRFLVALGMGGMGHGIAAGVGNALRGTVENDRRRTVVIAGDGAFYMHGMEIHTALEHDAALSLVILNNDAHGMCVTRDHLYFPNTYSVNRFRATDLAAGLDAMFATLDVRHARTADEVDEYCSEMFSATGVNCLVVDVDPDEIPPFAPFLRKGST
ncbi:thiamine pyrophosphate-binding protein [Gordonia sp. CPCC 206044]|uniref:thiamine pyrophosphate-binding protein n=1 Tax=Gordonia sp. CPCC 206044 TaxID=3140793 RepID=UPI003AF34047